MTSDQSCTLPDILDGCALLLERHSAAFPRPDAEGGELVLLPKVSFLGSLAAATRIATWSRGSDAVRCTVRVVWIKPDTDQSTEVRRASPSLPCSYLVFVLRHHQPDSCSASTIRLWQNTPSPTVLAKPLNPRKETANPAESAFQARK